MIRTFRAALVTAMIVLVVAGAAPVAAATAITQAPTATLAATTAPPASLNLYNASGFRFQDPNLYACTSTNAMDMLNFIALANRGGTSFRWKVNLSGTTRDAILAWERTHDTLKGGNGSDPHGWRNALNYYGWGSSTLWAGQRYYDDFSYSTYDAAMKTAVRKLIRYRKPVGILAWAGKHAQMVTGYYGLVGDPFAKDSTGRYTNQFTVSGFYLSDPLKSQGFVNGRISYSYLKTAANLKLRFRPYLETDSPYDDPYTAGTKPARDEWYNRFVIVAPVR